MPPASNPGFELLDTFSAELLFIGIALFAAIGALSHEEERPFSASIVYLALGLVAAVGVQLLDVPWLDPFEDAAFIEHLTEIALIVALFAAGLRVRQRLDWASWRCVALLLGVVMPLTIAAAAAFGTIAMGLPLGVAILLASALAPTDPVLAGGVGLNAPGEDPEQSDARFNLAGDASLNDALAGPFLLLGLFVLEEGGTDWALEWVLADVLYAVIVAAAVGAVAGDRMAALTDRLRERDLLSGELDGFLVIGVVLVVYGLVDLVDAYGFLAVFVAGVAFRRYEHGHEYNRRAHDGAQIAQNFLELSVILVLGSLVTFDALEAPGLAGWLIAPLLVLAVRPALCLAVLNRTHMPVREQLFVGVFGVKGVASIYYAAVILGEGVLSSAQEVTLFWTVGMVVMLSIVFHGVTATSLARRLL